MSDRRLGRGRLGSGGTRGLFASNWSVPRCLCCGAVRQRRLGIPHTPSGPPWLRLRLLEWLPYPRSFSSQGVGKIDLPRIWNLCFTRWTSAAARCWRGARWRVRPSASGQPVAETRRRDVGRSHLRI